MQVGGVAGRRGVPTGRGESGKHGIPGGYGVSVPGFTWTGAVCRFRG